MNITFKQLRVFVVLAQSGNLADAAEQLSISKAAVSMALQELERQLDCRLFERVRNRLQLNTQGRQLLPLGEELLQRVDAIQGLFLREDGACGQLRLGASHTVGNYLLPQLMADFLRLHPATEFRVQIDNTRTLAAELQDFCLDLVLVEGELSPEGVRQFEWMEDELQVIATPSHPLASRARLTMADLEGERWLLREQGSGSREQFHRFIGSHLQDWRLAMELNTTESLLNSVACGLGLCFISKLATQRAVSEGRVVVLNIEPTMRRYLRLAVHQDKYLHPTLEIFLAFCRQWRPTEGEGAKLADGKPLPGSVS